MDIYTYTQGDELEPLIYEHRRNGVAVDFTTPGWTFELGVADYADGVPITTGGFPKTTGMTGLVDGVQVDWSTTADQELNSLTPGLYRVQLSATRAADSRRLTLGPALIEIEPDLLSA